MAYPSTFHRLVIGGDQYAEHWNTTLNIHGATLPSIGTPLLTTVASAVETWFKAIGTGKVNFSQVTTLTHIKLNLINTAGHYAEPVSNTWTYPAPIPGGGSSTPHAPQLAGVVTLETGLARGLAHKGRVYLPAPGGFTVPSSDGRAGAGSAANIATSVASLINQINAAYASIGGGDFNGRVAIMSNVREGAWHYVTSVKAGRVIDTMRSRRSSLAEDYQASTVAISGA